MLGTAEMPSTDVAAANGHPARDTGKARVLLVDDNPNNLRVLRSILGSEEYDIIAVDSGQAALDLVGVNPTFNLILLDVAMPDLNGIEVCRRLKSDPHTEHIPILLISALKPHDATVREGLEAGADAYLGKPVDAAALRAWVRATLRISRFERGGEPASDGQTLSDRDVLERAARLSQRVNDPLQALCAAADLLALELPADAKGRGYVEEILAQAERVAGIVAEASREARNRLNKR
jgi:two-component system cell cycle response regulator